MDNKHRRLRAWEKLSLLFIRWFFHHKGSSRKSPLGHGAIFSIGEFWTRKIKTKINGLCQQWNSPKITDVEGDRVKSRYVLLFLCVRMFSIVKWPEDFFLKQVSDVLLVLVIVAPVTVTTHALHTVTYQFNWHRIQKLLQFHKSLAAEIVCWGNSSCQGKTRSCWRTFC